jgi:hypothetical protein
MSGLHKHNAECHNARSGWNVHMRMLSSSMWRVYNMQLQLQQYSNSNRRQKTKEEEEAEGAFEFKTCTMVPAH